MKQVLLAFQFLTIVPVRVSGDISERDIARAAAFFPAAGAFQGLTAACIALLSSYVFSPEITSGLVLLTFVVSNGGFHLDGLADTFDALAVKATGDPAKDRDRKLAVMKDSTTGAIGVIAIVMTILLKFLFLGNVVNSTLPPARFAFLFLMPVFSKWTMLPLMYHGVSARRDGLGKMFINNMTPGTVALGSLLLVLFCGASGMLFLHTSYGTGVAALFLFLIAVFYISCLLSVKFFKDRFGGLTGDALGAAAELSEILYLLVISLWLQHSI